MKISKQPASNITYLLYIGIVSGFIILAIYPHHTLLSEMNSELTSAKNRLEEQKILFPVFCELMEKARDKKPENLSFPDGKKLSKDEAIRVTDIFQKAAQKSNLEIEGMSPNVKSLIGGSGHLIINIRAKGDFFDFRNFIVKLCEMPYLEHMEQISIHAGDRSDNLEFRLKIRLAQE